MTHSGSKKIKLHHFRWISVFYLSFFPVVFPNSQRTVPFHPGPFSVFRTLRWQVRVKAAFKTRASRRWSPLCALNFASAPRNLHLVAKVFPNLKINFEPCLGLSGPMKQTRECLKQVQFVVRAGPPNLKSSAQTTRSCYLLACCLEIRVVIFMGFKISHHNISQSEAFNTRVFLRLTPILGIFSTLWLADLTAWVSFHWSW